ncbi:hypothetical protein [Catenulispora pinisilvae]|uniref:hypothetical protein n=1 Tax=Catenulispora pinisilvae TaxID=2705253 RepID=UPI001890CD9F|nr:hypothetical protein [Catenulispora pinisilvae]
MEPMSPSIEGTTSEQAAELDRQIKTRLTAALSTTEQRRPRPEPSGDLHVPGQRAQPKRKKPKGRR